MTKYVALLRGINVGGRIIKMDELKAAFEGIGFSNVTTLLQTGNVLFEANATDPAEMKNEIEMIVGSTFNYPAKVQVYSLEEIKKIIKSYPFKHTSKDFQHYVVFLEPGFAEPLEREAIALDNKVEEAKRSGGIIYWKVKKGMTLKSDFSKFLSRAPYKDANTVRNINTLQKLEK